jgi:uncharacterized protein (DUF427 family)
LQPSATVTHCPYKGAAGYYSAAGVDDLIWYYADPLPEAARIKGLLCFFNERVDVELDDELQERPDSPWSRARRQDARQPA